MPDDDGIGLGMMYKIWMYEKKTDLLVESQALRPLAVLLPLGSILVPLRLGHRGHLSTKQEAKGRVFQQTSFHNLLGQLGGVALQELWGHVGEEVTGLSGNEVGVRVVRWVDESLERVGKVGTV